MDEMSKNMSFEYGDEPKFREQETGHVYFKEGVDESTEPFAKNVKLEAHTEYTSHVNGKIGEGGDDSVLVSLIDRSITEIRNDSVTSVGDNAFAFCAALTTVDLPNAISVGESAFYGCSALTTVNLPNVMSIRQDSFADISSTAVINIGAAEGEITGAPWGAPNGVTINYNVRPTQEG